MTPFPAPPKWLSCEEVVPQELPGGPAVARIVMAHVRGDFAAVGGPVEGHHGNTGLVGMAQPPSFCRQTSAR